MQTLYHAAASVCSQKTWLALAGKRLGWDSRLLDMTKGEHRADAYLRLNPEGVVPTLVHNGFVLRESSVVIDYLDGLSPAHPLMPASPPAAALVRLRLIRCIQIHEEVNSMSFTTYIRDIERKRLSPDQIEDWIAGFPNPTLNFLRSVPPAAIVPLVIIAMGIGAAPKLFIIAITRLWPILLNTIDGVRGMAPQLADTARTFRVPHGLYFRWVLLMAALQQIMAGIRIAIAVALVLMVISEFFGASAGLGFYINEKKQAFAMVETWAGTLLIGLLGYLLSALFLRFERWALDWYFRSAAASGPAAP